MAYRALYRLYRPASFVEVAGQDHITDVLRNQVKLGHLSHAYLFCGPRGTGKTTMAKILSRAANCLSPAEGEPCGSCEMCRISAGANADIMEIDAASNNGVDNVRDLIDQAQFAPLQLKKRVFIIDEVHMLSSSAFNALLKTLEEPPEHVLFILATTEPEKLLPTVISRCQRFDFKRLSMSDIVNYMDKVLQKEGVQAEKDALRAVAHAADGGMRDALSLLNQCISVAGKTLGMGDVREVLGSIEEDLLFSLADKIITGDGCGCMEILDSVVHDGKDLNVLAKDLSAHIRALLLTSVCGKNADLLEVTEETAQRYQQQAAQVSKERLLYFSEELIKVRTSIRYFSNPRMLLETALLRIACPEGENSREALSARLSALEARAEAGTLYTSGSAENGSSITRQQRNVTLAESGSDEKQTAGEGIEPLPDPLTDVPPFEMPYTPAQTLKTQEKDRLIDTDPDTRSRPTEQNTDSPAEPAGMDTAQSVADGNAEKVYGQFLTALNKVNPLAAKSLNYLSGKRYEDNTLLLLYDPGSPYSANAERLKKPPFYGFLQDAAHAVRSDLRVDVLEKKQERLSQEDAHLQVLFGDKLTIE